MWAPVFSSRDRQGDHRCVTDEAQIGGRKPLRGGCELKLMRTTILNTQQEL